MHLSSTSTLAHNPPALPKAGGQVGDILGGRKVGGVLAGGKVGGVLAGGQV